MRKNIFQILQEKFDLYEELLRIHQLFDSICFVKGGVKPYTPEEVVDEYLFYNWKQRNRCVDIEDMKRILGINNIFRCKQIKIENAITYLEYVENVLYLAWRYVESHDDFNYYSDYCILCENIDFFLDYFNLETKYFDKEEMALIVEKDATVTAVAEIVPSELSLKVIKYNHYTLKGDIELKKEIILTLANNLEPKRKQIQNASSKVASDLFFLLNNLDLRHNNTDDSGKNYHPYIAKMKKETIEEWYDEVYQLELLAFLLIDNEQRSRKIYDLKQELEKAKNEQ